MKTSIRIILMCYIEKNTKEKKTCLIRTSVTDEAIYCKNSVKTGETSKQNKKIKKVGSKAVPKEKNYHCEVPKQGRTLLEK